MDYKYVMFDLDGTLTEPKKGITKSIAYALKYYGIKVEDLDSLCKYIGPPLVDTFMEGFGFDEKKALEAVEKYREYFSKKGLYENDVYDGIEELLAKLKKDGKKIFLATSKPTVFAKRILEHFDLIKYITFIAGSELDGTRNAKEEVIEYALEEIKRLENGVMDKNEVVMIGDRKYDMMGAKNKGIASVGVLYGYGDYEELSEAGADIIVKSVKSLIKIL